jgi:DNA-binding winged helix-turn-helix (wHTH) protein
VLATAGIFEFEEFRLDRQGEGLSRRDETGAFVPLSLGPRALDVLSVLVERAGELVTKEEIMAAVWRRSVVENANLTVQIAALRRILDQGRPEGSCIQTVAARGYRFIVPVTRIETADTPSMTAAPVAGAPRAAPHLSIVVLPFTDLSEDRRQQYFADGMTDDLTTDLSRLSGMFVIARNTAFTYRDKPIGANEQAIQEYQEALAFNPSWADALADLGMCKMWVGSLDEGIALQEQAIRLSPRDPRIGLWYHRAGIAHFLQSRIAEAIPWLEKGRAMFPTFPLAYSFLAAAYALNGEVERGAAELAEHYRLSGKTWVSTIADIKVTGYWGPPKIRELYEAVYFAGLRKLGVPEG